MHWLGTWVAIFCKHSYSITERYSHVHTNDSRLQCSAYHWERTRQPSVPTAFHAALYNMISFSAASLLEETGNISIESLKKKNSACKGQREQGRKVTYYDGLTAKVALVISSHFWAPGSWTWGWIVPYFEFGVVTWPDHGWSRPTCWQSSFLSKAWKNKPKKPNLALI